jgi:hypothetical protein
MDLETALLECASEIRVIGRVLDVNHTNLDLRKKVLISQLQKAIVHTWGPEISSRYTELVIMVNSIETENKRRNVDVQNI